MSKPGTNPNIPQIPQPVASVGSLVVVAQALKQAVDNLAGFRGPNSNRAATFDDLVAYGLISASVLAAPSGPGAVSGLAAEQLARIAGDATNTALTSAETTRAEAAEAVLTTAVSTAGTSVTTETARATAAEGVLTTHLATTNTNLATEVTRATTAEGTLTTNLASEVTRATAAEALLTPLTTANVGQYKGTITNDDATVGNIGEYIESIVLVAGAVSCTSGTAADVTTLSLTAGDWEVSGSVITAPAGTTTTTVLQAWVSLTSATVPTAPAGGYVTLGTNGIAGVANGIATGITRIKLAGTTTVYLSADAAFAVSTLGAYGILRARRAR